MTEPLQVKRDTTPVTINLTSKRPYRLNDEDREAVWAGPGQATVPAWVAQAWGLVEASAMPPTPALPPGAVSATVETVLSEPLKTTETVQEIPAPAVPKRSHSRKAG